MVGTQTTIEVDNRIERYAVQAKEAGLPRDQFANLLQGGYVAIDGMLPFHAACRLADKVDGPEYVALGGKRGPGKSHTIMAQVGLDDCQRMPRLKVLFLRKIQKAATESLEDLIFRVFRYTPHTFANNRVKFDNGSRIIIGGYKNSSDIEKYLGIEYDLIVLEEATQIDEDKKDKLRGSLRSSKPGWRPRIYMSTNADGIGLKWFKAMFIEPARQNIQHISKTWFLDVSHIYNPFVNQEYHDWLDTLKGALRKAWRDGDWDAFAGMAFPQWNYDEHVIEPFDIPDHWLRWRAIDWGSANPFACLWLTRDPDTRRIYVYREAYKAGLTTRQQARLIVDMTPPHERTEFTYADPAMWAKQNKDDQYFTSVDEYKAEGVLLTRADNDRINGKRKVDNALAILPDGMPGVQFFNHCTHVIEQMSTLARDEKKPEDVDTEQEDHAYDAFRYGLTNERKVDKKPPPKQARVNPLAGVKGL